MRSENPGAEVKSLMDDFDGLASNLINFLEYFGNEMLLGKAFHGVIQEGSGEIKFSRLLKAAGYEDNPEGFFSELVRQLEKSKCCERQEIKINNIVFPHLFLMPVLEKILPGTRFISVTNVSQLEELASVTVAEENRKKMQAVIERYPVRLSMHAIRQMRLSEAVARQYLPFAEELDDSGQPDTWTGQFHRGILEQMYQNRVILLLNMTCPVYCRFCFRKQKASRHYPAPTREEIKKAVTYIKNSLSIKEVLLTGGDPFLNKNNLIYAIDELAEIPHLQTLRIATRSVSYYPQLFYADNSAWCHYLKAKNAELRQSGKRMEIATHFVHPDEISPQSLALISDWVRNGLCVYVQTPFLKDCNDNYSELARLFSLLRAVGAEFHYLFMPCEPIQGSHLYWTHISQGLAAAAYLRAHVSDRCFPKFCTSVPIGKIEWHTSGWAVELDNEDENFFWIRTPYTSDYFKSFSPDTEQLKTVRVNAEGTLDVRYMGKIGDESLFSGSRPPREQKQQSGTLKELQAAALEDQRMPQTVVSTGSPTLFRIHESRAETDAGADIEAIKTNIAYLRQHERISDVVISSKKDSIELLDKVSEFIKMLRKIPHITAVRLRSLKFNYEPEIFTHSVIDKLGSLNKLTTVNPLRLEIETQFLHSDEFRLSHKNLTHALNNKGITVYNNTPLLSGVNYSPEEIVGIAYQCRQIGIEFHHLYAAGLPLQNSWNENRPVDSGDVIDIASRLRRDGSGREIPKYIIRTELGEVDFGLTSKLVEAQGQTWIKLLPYNLSYYRDMDAGFSLPAHVKTDKDGRLLIPAKGLSV
ncbi:MAG: hypothetical protein BWK80_23410 [Desulfobacteraceae bacterium IS3]|nr:MAG: hypothetical protein BWK80_23410 [Desulfobacteraceae bacterium IS3]